MDPSNNLARATNMQRVDCTVRATEPHGGI
jgi:hypothetical protein